MTKKESVLKIFLVAVCAFAVSFFALGIPFTLAAIVPAYIYIWLVFGI